MRELVERTGLEASEVAEVQASLERPMADILRFHRPSDAAQAKFSAEFGLAAVLLLGRIPLSNMSDAYVQSDGVQSLMRRVVVAPTDSIAGGGAQPGQVRVQTHGGAALYNGPVAAIVGSPERPLGAEELRAKFADCLRHGTAGTAEPSYIDRLMTRLDTIETMPDVRDIRTFVC
jgi:2-methylcitrate dehydratase PrpD